jgi:hypothetical protein
MHNSFKIIKTLLYSYSALHFSGTLVPITRRLLILHIQPPVTVCRWVGCIFQLWSVTTVSIATVVTDQSLRHPQHTQTGSNSSTIAADSSNGVTNTRCYRYSSMRS